MLGWGNWVYKPEPPPRPIQFYFQMNEAVQQLRVDFLDNSDRQADELFLLQVLEQIHPVQGEHQAMVPAELEVGEQPRDGAIRMRCKNKWLYDSAAAAIDAVLSIHIHTYYHWRCPSPQRSHLCCHWQTIR